jgi:hypothetical protein
MIALYTNKRYDKLKASFFSESLPGKPNMAGGEFYKKQKTPPLDNSGVSLPENGQEPFRIIQ